MFPSTFRCPATCTTTNSDALDTCFCKAKTLIRRPAAAELFFIPLCIHDTAAVLSMKRPTSLQRWFLVPTFPSKMIYARNFPAIYRMFISKSLPGFLEVISLARNVFEHSKRQFFGTSASFPGSQLLPTTSPDASTQPRNLGSPVTNSFDVVGLRAASFSSVLQYWNACFAAGNFPTEICAVSPVGFC